MAQGYRKAIWIGQELKKPVTQAYKAQWLLAVGRRFPSKSAACRVASIMVSLISRDGLLYPAKGWLAQVLRRSVKTVERALNDLKDAGFLTWQRRKLRRDGVTRQTSNAYQLQRPDPELSTTEADPGALCRHDVAQLDSVPIQWGHQESCDILTDVRLSERQFPLIYRFKAAG